MNEAEAREMLINDFFKLSTGQVALVGVIEPNLNQYVSETNADLYIGNQKVQTIHIIGEDRFSGGDEKKRVGIRSVRTSDNIISLLENRGNKQIKLLMCI